jgi:SAM-dependent methyltransferase
MYKLNLGCGSIRPDGWVNADSSINANLQRIPFFGKIIAAFFSPVVYNNSNFIYLNCNKKWKFKNCSFDIVYASHLFEHLSLKSSNLFLSEAYRVLKPGGTLRIVVPDLYQLAYKYITEFDFDINSLPSEKFMWAINMHREGQYGDISFLKSILLEIQGYPHQHKFMYDSRSLTKKMKEYNFIDFLNLSYGKSQYINCISDVEGTKESYLSIYIEAKKPYHNL